MKKRKKIEKKVLVELREDCGMFIFEKFSVLFYVLSSAQCYLPVIKLVLVVVNTHGIADPDPALFFSGFQDANKKSVFKKVFAYYLRYCGS